MARFAAKVAVARSSLAMKGHAGKPCMKPVHALEPLSPSRAHEDLVGFVVQAALVLRSGVAGVARW